MQPERQIHPAAQLRHNVSSGHSAPSPQSSEAAESPDEKIQRFIRLALERCGSASELARRLGVAAATVSQWRSSRKRPDAVHLICIQEIASRRSLLS